jgi:uncharacterized iron-regulated protein
VTNSNQFFDAKTQLFLFEKSRNKIESLDHLMNLNAKYVFFVGVLVFFQGCSQKTAFRPNGQRLAPEIFNIELRGADVVLLGERHGQAADHEGQFEILSKFSKATLGMEQINQNQNESLVKYLEIPNHSVSGLETWLQWSKRGWPKFSFYEPLISHARARDWKLIGLNMTSAELQSLDSKAFSQLPPSQQQQLIEEMIRVHPFEMTDELATKLARLQAARDFEMAKKINAQKEPHRVFIGVMGCGHVRKDRGVPFFLRQINSDLKVVSVCFHSKAQEVDYVWRD